MSRVDDDGRTRSARAEDDDPVLQDEAPPTHEPDAHDLAPDDSVDHLLQDEASARPSDQGSIEPDASAELDLLDAAPGAPGDPPPTDRQRAPAPPQRFTGAWREPVLPERRFARRSARDELMAGAPGAPLPDAPSVSPPPPRASGLLIKVTPRSETEPAPYGEGVAPPADPADVLPADPVDVLPPEVRVRVLEGRAAKVASMDAAIAREARRARTITLTMGALGLLSGGVTGSLLLASMGATIAAAVADGLLAAGAGFSTYRLGGGSLRGLLSFGLAAVVSASIKVALGAISLTSVADVAAFALLVGLTISVTLIGGFLGQRLDAMTFEDGT